MVIDNFYKDVLQQYIENLELFFDPDSGAVIEPGREDGTPKFLFTEVTGYALLDFLTLYRLTGKQLYIDKAIKSADWIKDCAQDPSGGTLTRYYFDHDGSPDLSRNSFSGRKIYAFDVGICLRGMVAVYRHTGNKEYLDSAIRMANFCTECLVDSSGRVTAIYDAKNGVGVTENIEVWSRAPGAFHTKVAEALVDLHSVYEEDKYLAVANAICNKALKFQSSEGLFETSKGRTELHPHCYATEGLLHVGRETQNSTFLAAARRATEWALSNCNEGEIAQSFDFKSGRALTRFRTDALSQVLALGSDLLQMGMLKSDCIGKLNELSAQLLKMKQVSGYYQYGFYEREFSGKLESDTRSYWTQMFCLRGLSKYYVSYLLKNCYLTVLAGGIGSRVWPISCESRPKPVAYSLLGDRSLLQETIRRYTHDYFFDPEKIYILCSASAMPLALEQASAEGVPRGNCVIEEEPKGTIPAVSLALDGLPKNNLTDERLVVVTMSDNVIYPYDHFQTAVVGALIAAREEDCLVSVGRPFAKENGLDERFGHIVYENQIGNYRVFEAECFREKPDQKIFDELLEHPGEMAWEGGTVVFRESYYRSLSESKLESGNLAEHLLCKAVPWKEGLIKQGVKVATSLLTSDIRFEDFGVPGSSVKQFFSGHEKYDLGNGNICLGRPEQVRIVSCENNLIISDELAIDIYGLDGFVIIDNATTNTTVLVPLSEVHRLPGLYRLFSGSKDYEAFVKGGPKALEAEATTFAEKCPNAHANSSFGLVFAYNFDDNISIQRSREGLTIINDGMPELSPIDFDALCAKQQDDQKLVQQLVQVGALSKAFCTDDLMLSGTAREILNKLSIYHAIGGVLTGHGEHGEAMALQEFESVSKLNRRLLDSRVIAEIINQQRNGESVGDSDLIGLLNENVSSAVEFIRLSKMKPGIDRDIIVSLLHVQDNPGMFASFLQDSSRMDSGEVIGEIPTIFSCFKIAQNLANGRWIWKRQKRVLTQKEHRVDKFNRGRLDDFPFIVAFSANWLRQAGIDADKYIDRLCHLLTNNQSWLRKAVHKVQGNGEMTLCDELFFQLMLDRDDKEGFVRLLETSVIDISDRPDRHYELKQLMELPDNLQVISDVSGIFNEQLLGDIKDISDRYLS